ncbi:MAG: hypothetical protein U0V04_07780 [Spirosomataceae bacterium]
MKTKIALLALFSVVLFASCRKQPCPAYGKTTKELNTISKHSV